MPRATAALWPARRRLVIADRKSTRLNSSHLGISYAVFCLKKKTVEDVDFLCGQSRGVWTEEKDQLLAARRINFERQLRLGSGKALPGVSGEFCIFGSGNVS